MPANPFYTGPDPTAIYNQTMAMYGAAEGQQMSIAAGENRQYNELYKQQAQYGASERLALQQYTAQQQAAQQQALLNQGLGNTTVLEAGARGINADYNKSLLTLNDQLLQRQNTIRQAQLGLGAQNQAVLAQLEGQQAGVAGQFGGEALRAQQAFGLGALQGQYSLAGIALGQGYQGQQGTNALTGQIQAGNQQASQNQATGALQAQQFGQQAALSGQQAQQQYGLQQAAAANQQQLSAQNYGQQLDLASQTGYY